MSECCWTIFGVAILIVTIVSGYGICKSVDDNRGYF